MSQRREMTCFTILIFMGAFSSHGQRNADENKAPQKSYRKNNRATTEGTFLGVLHNFGHLASCLITIVSGWLPAGQDAKVLVVCAPSAGPTRRLLASDWFILLSR